MAKQPHPLELTAYLVIGKSNRYPKFAIKRTTLTPPTLQPDERAIRIVLKTDRAFFEPVGFPTATLNIPEDALILPDPTVEVETPREELTD